MQIQSLIGFAGLLLSTHLLGQGTPKVEVFAGYSVLKDQFSENRHGWVASVTRNYNRWFGIAGEGGGNYASYYNLRDRGDYKVYSFLAGPRFSVSVW